ncbi:MAG TPA: precorrin-3B synthase [Mycobacteriales bacterium]|nr:precorrin-3B synthase [Mycobacteriales bacterium]
MPIPSPGPPREVADRCPGALTRHEAADGWLARIRLPGGMLSAVGLAGLADLAERYGDGRLELTSRGNVQLRALPTESDFADRLADLGLLPSATHERVRNIVASPLATGLADLVRELDRQLCDRPELAALPGRFLFGLDDGRGEILALRPDVPAIVGEDAEILGLRVTRSGVVATMLAAAQAFLDERAAQASKAWRLAELADGPARVANRVAHGLDLQTAAPRPVPAAPAEPAGPIRQPDGRYAAVLLAPLGRLTAARARLIAGHAGETGVRVTPWRSVVIPDLTDPGPLLAAAAAAGLGTGRDSRWYGVSACTGRPGCAKALADVQLDAAENPRSGGIPVHWSGCERRCGRPASHHLDVLATTDGYLITEQLA